MRSKWIVLVLAFVAASYAPGSAAVQAASPTAPVVAAAAAPSADSVLERSLGLSAASERGGTPDQYCWIETRWVTNGCGGCYLKARLEQQERQCCQYTGCGSWQNNGNWTCNYACGL